MNTGSITLSVIAAVVACGVVVIIASVTTGDSAAATTAVTNVVSLISGVSTLVVALTGAVKERGKPAATDFSIPMRIDEATPATQRTPEQRLARSFEAGVYGGLAGGAFAGLIMGFAYSSQVGFHLALIELSGARLVAEIFIAGCVGGALLGAAIQFGAHWFRYVRDRTGRTGLIFNEPVGATSLGSIAGALFGVVLGLTFGPRPIPMIDGNLIVIAAVLGAVAIPAAALGYDFRGQPRLLMRAFLLCSILTAICLVPVAVLLFRLDIFDWFYRESFTWYAAGGAVIGACLGGAMGAEVGSTMRLHRFWSKLEEDIARPMAG